MRLELYLVAGPDEVDDEAERERAEPGVEQSCDAPRVAGRAVRLAVRLRRRPVRSVSHLQTVHHTMTQRNKQT